jgi:hypothetical protein
MVVVDDVYVRWWRMSLIRSRTRLNKRASLHGDMWFRGDWSALMFNAEAVWWWVGGGT